MSTPEDFAFEPSAELSDLVDRLTPDALQAIRKGLVRLACSRDDARARLTRHAHVLGYCAHFQLISRTSGPVIRLLYLSPCCREEHGEPELLTAT